jgi:hypothetical protein
MHVATLTKFMTPPGIPLNFQPSTYHYGFPRPPKRAEYRRLIVSLSRLGIALTHRKQSTGTISNRRSDGGMCNILFAPGQNPRNLMEVKEIIANQRARKAKSVVPAFPRK